MPGTNGTAIGSTADFRNSYTYDALQRLTGIVQQSQSGGNSVTAKRVAFSYNNLGQRTQIARFQSTGTANPVATTDFTYDTANRLSGIAHKQGPRQLRATHLFDIGNYVPPAITCHPPI